MLSKLCVISLFEVQGTTFRVRLVLQTETGSYIYCHSRKPSVFVFMLHVCLIVF